MSKRQTEAQTVRSLCDLVVEQSSDKHPGFAARRIAEEIPEDVARMIAARFLTRGAVEMSRHRTLAEERRAMRDQLMREVASRGGTRVKRRRTADEQAELDAIRAEHFRELMTSARGLVEEYTKQIRMEWTEELRAASFALPDGSMVTWGEATVDQHEMRAAWFTHQAGLNAEGAARHMAAVRDLMACGAPSLNELVTAA